MPAIAEAARRVPTVLLDRELDRVLADSVRVDHAAGIAAAVEHLRSIGRSRFAFISAQPNDSAARLRLAAFLTATRQIDPDAKSRIQYGNFSSEHDYSAMRALLRSDRAPDAVVCGADIIALGALKALRDGGLAVPDDIAVTGFDDILFASISSPALTTVRQPTHELASECVRLLTERLMSPSHPVRQTVVRPTLIVRASTVGDSP